MGNIMKTGSSRVWVIPFRAGPNNEPVFLDQGAAGTISFGQGDITKIEAPNPDQYGEWIEIDDFQVSADRPTTTIQVYEDEDRSIFMDIIRTRCALDIQIHKGQCEDPRDFNLGWTKIKNFENSKPTSYDTNEQGSLEGGGQASVIEDLPVSAQTIYDILRMVYRSVAQNEVGEEVIAVDVCDNILCGECEGIDSSDGCQKVFAVTNSATSSPGVLPQVIITTDQYGVLALIERWVTTFAIGENASDAACVGANFVVISSDGEAIHFAPSADMITETETWTKVSTGVVAAAGPTAIWNYSPLLSFLSGLGGYIYQMKNPEDGLTVLDAASNVTDDLNDISGWDAENVAAVGDTLAFVYTTDGSNFNTGTGPVGPTNLEAVDYRKEKEIWVGGTASGSVYYTINYGTTWTTKALPGSLTQIDKILWNNETVGWIAGRNASSEGVLLRTINGGFSWYVVPEAPGLSIPTADYFNDLAVCDKEVNKIFIGGLADNAADGILIKGSD